MDELEAIDFEAGEGAVADIEESLDSIRADLSDVKADAEAELSQPLTSLESALDAFLTDVQALQRPARSPPSPRRASSTTRRRERRVGGSHDGGPRVRPEQRSPMTPAGRWTRARNDMKGATRPSVSRPPGCLTISAISSSLIVVADSLELKLTVPESDINRQLPRSESTPRGGDPSVLLLRHTRPALDNTGSSPGRRTRAA